MKEFKLHPFKNILHVETLLTDKDPRSVYFGSVSLAAESKTTQCDFCRLSLHSVFLRKLFKSFSRHCCLAFDFRQMIYLVTHPASIYWSANSSSVQNNWPRIKEGRLLLCCLADTTSMCLQRPSASLGNIDFFQHQCCKTALMWDTSSIFSLLFFPVYERTSLLYLRGGLRQKRACIKQPRESL